MKILTKATDIAKAMNFGKYPVLTMNTDTKHGSKAIVLKKSDRYGMMRYGCTLEMDFDVENDGILYISTNATMVKSDYSWQDHLESAEYANAPIISADQEIAVYMYSPKARTGCVRLVKSEIRIDAMCSVATKLIDLEEVL